MEMSARKEVENKQLSIGIDYGGVCNAYADTESKIDHDLAINIPDCENALRELKAAGYRLVLISFSGAARAKKTYKLLEKLELFDKLYFVKRRNYKRQVCEKEGIDVMIDDRLDVLRNINNTKTMLFNMYEGRDFGSDKNVSDFKPNYTAKTWSEVLQNIYSMNFEKIIPNDDLDITKCFVFNTITAT
jgi:hypothetical protein